MGRRSKATEARIEVLLGALVAGSTREAAAGHAGVDRTTLFRWLKQDRAIRARVEKAEDDASVRLVALIAQAAPQDWHAAAWLLKHRWPAVYGDARILAAAAPDAAAVAVASHPLDGLSKVEQANRMREWADTWAAEAAEEDVPREGPQ